MNKIDKAVEWAVAIANDDTHGYDQVNRWGNPDYDCSSLIISAWEQAGVPVKTKGATYTGNMKKVFLACGFIEVPIEQRQKGDILLNEGHHTAMMIDSKNIVHASINEQGKIVGGKKGDQTTKEICTRTYYKYSKGWDCCLRYVGEDAPKATTPRNLKKGSKGDDVKELQKKLNEVANANLVVDGDFGALTDKAVRAFQKSHGLEVDGIVGVNTRNALKGTQGTWDGFINTVRDPLNVRATSNPSSRVLKMLAKGSTHKFKGDAVNGMYQLADGSGWCASSLVKKL